IPVTYTLSLHDALPIYIELAFKAAFTRLGGRIARRERGRYEIANVPAHLRAGKHGPIATRYNRVTFDLAYVAPADGLVRADLLRSEEHTSELQSQSNLV